MGIRMITEVLDHAPPGLTSSERIVLIVIAENARDETRRSYNLSRGEICRRSGLSPATVQKVFWTLREKHQLDVREPIGTDKHDQPVYAHEGRQSTYRMPRLDNGRLFPERVDEDQPSDSREGGPQSTLTVTRVNPLEPERVDEDQPLPLNPQNSSDARATESVDPEVVDNLVGRTGLSVAECQSIADAVNDKHRPRSLLAYVRQIPDDQLLRYRGRPGGATSGKCSHGVVNGFDPLGSGDDASRRCGRCETSSPAVREAS